MSEAEALARANHLMVEALSILDHLKHGAAARLDHAIVELGVRPKDQGYPLEEE